MTSEIKGREILDSRGNPTVEVEVLTESGFGRAEVPSGASTGSNEAWEKRDGDKGMYGGKGVREAVKSVNTVIKKELVEMDVLEQREIDERLIELDGTENKERMTADPSKNPPFDYIVGGLR